MQQPIDDNIHLWGRATAQHSVGGSDPKQDSPPNDALVLNNGAAEPVNVVSDRKSCQSRTTHISDQQQDIIKLYNRNQMTTNYKKEENSLRRIIRSNIQQINLAKQIQLNVVQK